MWCGLIFEFLKRWLVQHNNTKASVLDYIDDFLYNLCVATLLNRYSVSVVLLYSKQKLRVCSKVKTIDNESHSASTIASQNVALVTLMYDLDITNILVVSPQIRYVEVFDITNPSFNEQIWPVP